MEKLSSRGPARVMGYIELITTVTFTVLVIGGLTLELFQRIDYPHDSLEPDFVFDILPILALCGLIICLETALSRLLLKATKWNAEPEKSLKRVNWWICLNVASLVLVVIGEFLVQVESTDILVILLLVRVVMLSFVWHYQEELNRYCFENPSKPLLNA